MRSYARHLQSTVFKLKSGESFTWDVVQEPAKRRNGMWYLCGSAMWYLRASLSIPSP